MLILNKTIAFKKNSTKGLHLVAKILSFLRILKELCKNHSQLLAFYQFFTNFCLSAIKRVIFSEFVDIL